MHKWVGLTVLTLVAAAGVLGYQMTVAQSAVTPATTLAVVDVMKVLTQCQENLDREQVIEKREQEFEAKLNTLKQQAQAIREELEQALKPGTDEYMTRMQEWFNKTALVEAYDKGQRQAFAAETQAWMEMLYRKFLDETAELARLEEISLILAQDNLPLDQATKLSELSGAIRSRKVLYASPTLEVTGRVMERMDRSYAQHKAQQESPALVAP
jgi:Skp family chaperone for outer membrane proteins